MLKSIFKKYYFVIIPVLIALPAILPLLKPGIYYNMHDDMQLIRQLELEKCFYDGQIPCRWVPDLGYGYGFPLFNYYPPLPYLVGQIFRFLGFSFIAAVKLTAITNFFLASVFIYILANSIFGPTAGLLAAVFYTYAPYHAVNIYVRGAMNEAWAAVFFPLIFYYSRNLILKKRLSGLFGLSFSFAGLLLSHIPMALTFFPLLVVWCLFHLLINHKNLYRSLLCLFLSGCLSFFLTAFFILPVIFESNLVQIDTMFSNYYHYSVHFTSLYQLFISNFWGEGPSVWGQADQMSFMVGYAHWILPILTSIIAIILFIRKKSKNTILFIFPVLLTMLGFFTAFMTHQKSVFLWQIFAIIQKIQFPWRFLNHTVFLFSLAVSALPFLLHKILAPKKIISIVTAISIFVFVININYFHPQTSGPITDIQKFTGKAWANQITSGVYDYLPKTAKSAPKSPAKTPVDQLIPEQKIQISGQKKGTDWSYFNLDLQKNSRVILAQLYFPDFQVFDNSQKITAGIDPELGRIVIDLSAGYHQIYLKLNDTLVRFIGNYLTLLSLIIVLIYYLYASKRVRQI